METKQFSTSIITTKTDYLFFRGTKEDYLLPSIVPKRNRLSAQQLQYIEKRMQSEFNALTNQKTDSVEQQIKAIICAREHGLCNRMLDWSSTFHIALVFATDHVDISDDGYVYLWILNKLQIKPFQNDGTNTLDYENIKEAIFFHNMLKKEDFDFSRRRQSIQGGSFLALPWTKVTTPINDLHSFQDKLICIKISKAAVSKIREEITSDKGYNPDANLLIQERIEDKIARRLNSKYLYEFNSALQ